MTDTDLLNELLELASRLGIEVRWASGEFKGGVLRLRGNRILYLNVASPPARAVELLSQALQGEDLSRLYLLPAVRNRLERPVL